MLVRRTVLIGATGLPVAMAGAVATHLQHGEALRALVPLVLLVLLGVVGYTRYRRV